MAPAPLAGDPSATWTDSLERALALAHAAARELEEPEAPAIDLAPALRRIELGIAALCDAYDDRADRASALSVAHGRLWDAAIAAAQAGSPAALAALHEACVHLIAAEERLAAAPPPAARAPSPLRGTSGAPAVHAAARPSFVPSFRAPPPPKNPAPPLPAPPPPPTTFEALAERSKALRALAAERRESITAKARAATSKRRGANGAPPAPRPKPPRDEPPPGFATAPPRALSDDAFARRWARDLVDEIGMLGAQRAPMPGETFRACAVLEQRMLHAIDALAALGPAALAHVEPLANDAPIPDPMRLFAVAMIAGCTSGRDALAAAERVFFRYGPADPPLAASFVSAMLAAPHPLAATMLRTLAAPPRPADEGARRPRDLAARAAALEVLARRGWLTPKDLSALAAEALDDVYTSAPPGGAPADVYTSWLPLVLPAFGATRHPDLDRVATAALASDSPALIAAALDAYTLAAHPRAPEIARATCESRGPRYLVHLALVARKPDAAWIAAQLRDSPSPDLPLIEAAGWTGHLDAVAPLIAILENHSASKDQKATSATALDRLLGASLHDTIEVDPDALESPPVIDPDPDPPPQRRPLADLIDDARDRSTPGSPDTLEVPSTSADRWRAAWTNLRPALDPTRRHRRGRPHDPSVSLWELDKLPLPSADRLRLHRELAHRTGEWTRFDPADFVPVQEASLRAWDALVKRARFDPGAW